VRDDPPIFFWALLISLLLHVLLLFLVFPGLSRVWQRVFAVEAVPKQAVTPEKPPLEFEFVDLPDDREEKPLKEAKPKLSDRDRRAHGGQGETATTPSSEGNTPELVQAEGSRRFGSGARPRQPAPQSRPVPPAQPRPPAPEKTRPLPVEEEGFEPEKKTPETARPQEPARIQLPPIGSITLPQGIGGIRENPDRRGGMVDSGGLSFDTQWYDWGPYAKLMLAKIRRNWRIPEIAQLGVAGRVRIRFFIEADGTVTGLRITDESGKPPMDFAARDAIAHSSPFNPLPADLTGVDKEGVTITFFYNSNPPERAEH